MLDITYNRTSEMFLIMYVKYNVSPYFPDARNPQIVCFLVGQSSQDKDKIRTILSDYFVVKLLYFTHFLCELVGFGEKIQVLVKGVEFWHFDAS